MVKISWLVLPKKICIYSSFLKSSKYSQKHKGSTFRCVGTGEATVSPKFRDILKGIFFRKIGLIYREKILELHLEKLVPPPLSTFTLRKNNITIHYKWWASSNSGPKMKHFFADWPTMPQWTLWKTKPTIPVTSVTSTTTTVFALSSSSMHSSMSVIAILWWYFFMI